MPLSIPFDVDPDLPPGVLEVFPGERARIVIGDSRLFGGEAARLARADPQLAEDIRSLLESKDWVTYPGEASEAIRCECCGTPVVAVPEAAAGAARRKRAPAIWEPRPWRKHTLRRCDALRRLGERVSGDA